MYDGDFNCPAIHIFMSSATLIGNTITNNQGDGLRIKAGIVNVQDNNIETSEIGEAFLTMMTRTAPSRYNRIFQR